jgi:3-phosphoglycerate kinase
LENLRFHKEEEENNPEFAKKLSQLADIYINDAFGAAHRAHASTEGITHFLPSYAGTLMYREIEMLSGLITKPEKPFVAIIGGAKVSSKIKILKNLFNKVDIMLIGGGMGRGRIALAIHGKLLLGMGSGRSHVRPRRLRRCAAAGAVRQDARRTQFPERAPDRATA